MKKLHENMHLCPQASTQVLLKGNDVQAKWSLLMHLLLSTNYHDKRKHLLKMHICDYYVYGQTGGFETNQ